MTEQLKQLETLTEQWEATAKTRRAAIMAVLSHVNNLVSSYIAVERDDAAYAFLTPGKYHDDTFYNGHRQYAEITEPGMYLLDYGYWDCEGRIALDTNNGIKSLRLTKGVMPDLVKAIETAIDGELRLTNEAMKSESLLLELAEIIAQGGVK